MIGRYCEKHEEWAPDGECRWCEPGPGVVDVGRVTVSPAEPLMFMGVPVIIDPNMRASDQPILVSWSDTKLRLMMNDAWVALARKDKKP